uniref:ULP_PROTEASE domain-containing protein n=1 Tax=Panagrellus redivivus TaxID=6233 RepID=A0A7E4V744_PANRE
MSSSSVALEASLDEEPVEDDPFFDPCNVPTTYLKSAYVAFGTMVNKVCSKQIAVHNGALVFNMEVRVPKNPNTTERYSSYTDYTSKTLHIRLFFYQIVGVHTTCLDDNAGGFALAVTMVPERTQAFQDCFKKFGLPAAVCNDDRYHTFIFEVGYNYYESFKHMNLFLAMCNYWFKEYFPERTSPVTGFLSEVRFNLFLLPAELCLTPVQNVMGYDCYQFAHLAFAFHLHDDAAEVRRTNEDSIVIPLSTHTTRFKLSDVNELLTNLKMTSDMVDFYIWYANYVVNKTNRSEVAILPTEFYQMFTKNFDSNDTPVERSYQVGVNWKTIKARYLLEDDLFEKKYILMPICSADHWYLVIISDPSAAILPTDSYCGSKVKFIDGCHIEPKPTEFENIVTFMEFHFIMGEQQGKYIGKSFHRERYSNILLGYDTSNVGTMESAILTALYAERTLMTPTLNEVESHDYISREDLFKFSHDVYHAITYTLTTMNDFDSQPAAER